jgi:hypothetical protein
MMFLRLSGYRDGLFLQSSPEVCLLINLQVVINYRLNRAVRKYHAVPLYSELARENKDQIPTESNVKRTEDVLQKQSIVEGMQRDEMFVRNFPKAAALAQILRGLSFPTDKKKIIGFVNGSFPDNSPISQAETIELVDKVFDDRQYYNVAEIVEAARLSESSAA